MVRIKLIVCLALDQQSQSATMEPNAEETSTTELKDDTFQKPETSTTERKDDTNQKPVKKLRINRTYPIDPKPRRQLKVCPTFDGDVDLAGPFVQAVMTDEDMYSLCISLPQSERTALQAAFLMSLGM